MSRAIILIGMAGSGKTTVGREAARLLGRPFVDVDAWIERRFGSIQELFRRGEAHFRQCESQVVLDACAVPGAVIATGGGVVTQPASMGALKRAGVVVFLDRPIDRITAEIDLSTRPLYVCGIEALRKTYVSRLPLYRRYADAVVSNNGSVEDACRMILEIAKEDET